MFMYTFIFGAVYFLFYVFVEKQSPGRRRMANKENTIKPQP